MDDPEERLAALLFEKRKRDELAADAGLPWWERKYLDPRNALNPTPWPPLNRAGKPVGKEANDGIFRCGKCRSVISMYPTCEVCETMTP